MNMRISGLAITLLGVVAASGSARPQAAQPLKSGSMVTEVTYTQLYVGSDGETHFREVKVPVSPVASAPPAQPFPQSALQPATTIRHVVFPAHWGVPDRDSGLFHPASGRRFITVRSGVLSIKASDGETRRFAPGDMVEVLDIAPAKGHITWAGDEPAVALFSNHP